MLKFRVFFLHFTKDLIRRESSYIEDNFHSKKLKMSKNHGFGESPRDLCIAPLYAPTQKLRPEKGCSQHYLGELQLVKGAGIVMRTGVVAAAGASRAAGTAGAAGAAGTPASRSGNESRSSSGSSSGSMAAHKGDSNQDARFSRPAAQAAAGKARDLAGLSTAAAAAAPPQATTHGPTAEALLEGEKYGAETEDAAEASGAAAAARLRPPRPADWVTMTRGQRKNWKKRGGKRH